MASSTASDAAATAPASAAGPASEWQRLDRQLCFALYSTSLAMTKLYKPLLEPLALTYPQYLVLLVLWQHGTIGMGELGEQLCLDSGTLTPLLKRLQSAGWLERTRAADDERRVVVSLTPAGRSLRRKASSIPPEVMQATQCGVDELTELTQSLQKLRSRLQSAHPAPNESAH